MRNIIDAFQWTPVAVVDKFSQGATEWVQARTGILHPDTDTMHRWVKPYETLEIHGNLLTTAGLNRLTNLLIGGGGTAFNATNCRVGVGDDTTAAAVGDTDLSTGTNQYYTLNDATYPQQANGVVTFKGAFATGEANFAWQCWGIDNGTADGSTATAPLLNRKVSSMGTKSTGTWTLTVTITFS